MHSSRISVVVGVDGSGRSRRLAALSADGPATPITRGVRPDEAFALVRSTRTLVTVDDAHLLPPHLLRAVADGARGGAPLLIARRPTITSPELAELDAVAAMQGRVLDLEPLNETETARLIAEVTGEPADLDHAARVHHASAGLPVWITDLAAHPDATHPAAVPPGGAATRARVSRILGSPGSAISRVANVLALGVDLADELVAEAVGLPVAELVAVLHDLAESGLLVPGEERLIPIVAETVTAIAGPPERRRAHGAIGRVLRRVDPVLAAGHLHRAGATSPDVGDAYIRAGERSRFVDPAAAVGWFELAVAVGADPNDMAGPRAEADLMLGRAPNPDAPVPGYTIGVGAAHAGRSARAADALRTADPPGPLLAVLPLVIDGRLDDARALLRSSPRGSRVALRLAEAAVVLATDPAAAVPLLIEAAEDAEHAPPSVVLPDTPPAVAAIVAVTAGDTATAEDLLTSAISRGLGGPAATDRHRLILAWVRMRAGRYDTAREELRRLGPAAIPGRERLLLAALAAGLARRSGEMSRLREAWSRAQQALGRRTVDLLTAEMTEELVVAATRLREHHRVTPILDDLDAIIGRLDRPSSWQTTLGWLRLQVAVAADDADAARAAARSLPETSDPRQRAQFVAAHVWTDALAGSVDTAAVLDAADQLAAASLPWEASRLCGHAAIRTGDPADARRLLERARDLTNTPSGPTTPATAPTSGPPAGLSEREVEVARMVLAGQTYKVIGAQLFLSPKTVEHHVARIRTKVGAGSRAEMVAALRELLE